MRLETRSVHIAGVTTAPNSAFMQQMGTVKLTAAERQLLDE